MRLSFIVIFLGVMVSAKKRKPKVSSSSDESFEVATPLARGYLNLEGSVRREFALEAALEDHARNMICSPLSVLMPLGKLAMGAGRRTEKELLKALHLSNRDQLNPTFAQLITSLEYLPGVTLDMANRIYVSTKKSINKKFAYSTELIFKSSCQKIRPTDPKKTANTINQWVAEKTRNKITQLVSSRDITEDTSLILVNAIYFAGKWLNKFDKIFTDDFFSPAGRHKIPMMSRQGKYNYWKCDTLNAQIIEIPYEGLQSAMIVVLPYSNTGLGFLLRALKVAPDLLNSALMKMKITDVILTMPKFKIESEMDLNVLYKKVGVRTIFDNKRSDLNGIIDDENVFVSKAIHKAVIEVTETGTEASAATARSNGVRVLDINRFHTSKYEVRSASPPDRADERCRERIALRLSDAKIKRKIQKILVALRPGPFLFPIVIAIILGTRLAPLPSTEINRFVANHPFYFIIKANQEQLFAGIFNG